MPASAASGTTATATYALFCATVASGVLLSRRRKVFQDEKIRMTDQSTKRKNVSGVTTVGRVERSVMSRSSSTISDTTNPRLQRILTPGTITIAYTSTTGTCAKFARLLHQALTSRVGGEGTTTVQLAQVEEFDWWDEFLNRESNSQTSRQQQQPPVVVFVLPTFTGGSLPPNATQLLSSLHEISTDWRIEKRPLSSSQLRVSVFGMGSSAYDTETFCKPAKDVWGLLLRLGASKVGKLGLGDDEVGDAEAGFRSWMDETTKDLVARKEQASSSCACKEDGARPKDVECCQNGRSGTIPKSADAEEDDEEGYGSDDDDQGAEEPELMDLEEIGPSLQSQSQPIAEPKEMVTPKQAAALKKEGYKLIGTHSAVKLCRWTKHQLRGRGGCYKHTFYGITSYQCMEATPSLACANKCVFCWRHHKNPVGKEWRWKTDDPNFIVSEAIRTHVAMIKETKGIPGVRPDRWADAHTVRHCALSLVGEPIMYPRIDDLLSDLHSRSISSFLVTNGQHPDAIERLRPVTQLYVSVDAPTPESLDAIDRPLFKDAWGRLRTSLRCLREKGQRTVARLTVVKGWNSDEIGGYAELIALGRCSLVEVKGVTFCGKSDASNLNMSNTPWHHEVVALTQSLQKELAKLTAIRGPDEGPPEYGLACEHKHSCSVLLARVDQFAYDDPDTGVRKWKTWIDYDKFHDLATKQASDPNFTFTVQDYTAETPSWALFGAEEEGFDPTDTRHRKKRKHPKYTKFDDHGVPTHDHNGVELDAEERERLSQLMEEKKRELAAVSGGGGDSSSSVVVTDLGSGAKSVEDASLMFRGLVVTK